MALATLPTELVENITNNLDLSAFRSIRSVCRQLRVQSTYQFKERFFHRRHLDWTTESFRAARAVASHPQFADALQEVVIDATPRHAIRLWILEALNADSIGPLHDDYLTAKCEADKAAEDWDTNQRDHQTLVKVFEKIKSLRSITFYYEGIHTQHRKLARRYCERSQDEMSHPFVVTMRAIIVSGITVENIFIDDKGVHGAVSIGRLELLYPMLSKFDTAFEHLQTLNLNLRDWRVPEEESESLVGKTPFIVRFLANCKNVRNLELSCYSTYEDTIFAEMAQHCKYPHLEYCKLGHFSISAMDDLLTFLSPAKDSLQSLSLNHIILQSDDEIWPDVMSCMALGLNRIQWVHLKNLFTRLGARIEFRGAVSGSSIMAGPWSITVVQPRIEAKLQHHAERLATGLFGRGWYIAPCFYPFIGLRI